MTTRRAALAAISFAALAVGAFAPAFAQDKGTIGIAMPTQSSARWISDGNSMVEQFEAAGYDTDLQYAEDDIPTQLAQIENMITTGRRRPGDRRHRRHHAVERARERRRRRASRSSPTTA